MRNIAYYRDDTGSYLAINIDTDQDYQNVMGKPGFYGKSASVDGLPSSVSSCGIGARFLQSSCVKVDKSEIPADWLEAIEGSI